jgi:hypothetical protein
LDTLLKNEVDEKLPYPRGVCNKNELEFIQVARA